jgi:hypothetical protein
MFRNILVLLMLVISPCALAGVYGSENWGEMYWGDNPVSTPNAAPTISSVVARTDQITITLDNFPQGTGADGWSAITSYIVTCGETTVETSDTAVTITGLDSDTEYSCSVSASNAAGDSPATVQVVMTDPELQGLNLFLICAVVDCAVS